MLKNQLSLKIAYLYPDFLQGLCDKANLVVFKKRAQERNINIQIEEIKNEDKILHSSKYDFYYISGSNVEALEVCNSHLSLNVSHIKDSAENEIPMLAINCGYVLFGNSFQLDNSPLYHALSVLNVSSRMSDVPFYSKIKGLTTLVEGPIVGFSNHLTATILENDAKPFLECAGQQKDGAVYKNVIGTYITSPILAQNPHFCDYLISKCLEVKYKHQIPLAKLTDDIEWYSNNYLLEGK